MSDETAVPTRKRGRPTIPKEDKVNLKFHLVLMKEEMDLLKAATKIEGLPSTAIFIRSAIDHAGNFPPLLKEHISKGLTPSNEDATTYHYLLLLSASSRETIEREDFGHRCEFIRTAALNRALGITTKDPAFKAALSALKAAKGVE